MSETERLCNVGCNAEEGRHLRRGSLDVCKEEREDECDVEGERQDGRRGIGE